jgi:hypothetical protein
MGGKMKDRYDYNDGVPLMEREHDHDKDMELRTELSQEGKQVKNKIPSGWFQDHTYGRWY